MVYKILLVDDDKDMTDSLNSALTRHGYEVGIANDGEEALIKVGLENPDIVILDLMLPKLNGFDVLKSIRSRQNKKWCPIIIVSAKAELEAMKQCYTLEADHYLTKPCTLDNILRGIETMISLIPLRVGN